MKSKKTIGLLVVLLLSMMVVLGGGGLHAQTTMPDDATSPTNTSTSGRYKTAIDDFIQPTDYLNLKLGKWFGAVNFTGGTPHLGFATQLNDLYLALYYKGKFWEGRNDFTSIEKTIQNFNDSTNDKSLTEYTIPDEFTHPDNSVALMLGVANMGFRLGVSYTLDSFNKSEDMEIDGDYYKSYVREDGNLVPHLKWGMAKDLMAQGIRPWVNVMLNFHRENTVADMYTSDSKSTGEVIANSANYFAPTFQVGLGSFAFYNENGFKGSFDLEYKLQLFSYSNDFSYIPDITAAATGDPKFETGNVKGIASLNTNTGAVSATEKSKSNHDIYPSISGSWSSGNLGVKAKLRGVLNFDKEETSVPMALKYDNTGKSSGTLENTVGNATVVNVFTFTPRLDLGVQYKIVPDKLTLNAGGRIAKPIKTTTTETTVYWDDPATPANDIVENSKAATTRKSTDYGNTPTSLTYRIYAGAQFNFTENVWVEGTTGVQSGVDLLGNSDNNNLVNFSGIALGLKF